jgi:hypothetical protein
MERPILDDRLGAGLGGDLDARQVNAALGGREPDQRPVSPELRPRI